MIRRLALLLLLAACHDEPSRGGQKQAPPKAPATKGPDRVTYDHILIAFKGSYQRIESFRSQEEARRLAYSILDRLRSGADFEVLKQEYSDDRDPNSGVALGPYVALNDGAKRKRIDELRRHTYHPLMAHVIFNLKVHEVKMADWHAKDCPLGWHIVKRLE